MSDSCPIQVTLYGHWIDCTFPAGHDPWLHSWQTPGESPFVMAPHASEVRNRDGGPLGYPYDEPTDEEKLAAAETAARADERERIAREFERVADELLAARSRLSDRILHPAMAEVYRHCAEIARATAEVAGDG